MPETAPEPDAARASSQPPAALLPVARGHALAALQGVAALFYERGWAYGTSGNYSVMLGREPLRLLVTASGRDKRHLAVDDFVDVDGEGRPFDRNAPRPSAETLLHTVLARHAGAGAVLHVHSVWNTLLSERYFERGEVPIRGYEMLKGLAGITTHEAEVRIPIFDNTQDIPALAEQVSARLRAQAEPLRLRHAFLIRAHGLYTWGRDLAEARRHVEIIEFLLEVIGTREMLPRGRMTS